jgi:hypothetical protein
MQFPKLTSIEEIAQVNLAAAVALVKGLRQLAEIQARHPLAARGLSAVFRKMHFQPL